MSTSSTAGWSSQEFRDKTHGMKDHTSAAVLELFASRICHDLISPVGAVHNGVEFLQETGADGAEDAIGLIAHSVQQASARLQVFRLAYGAGGRDPNITPADVQRTFAEMIDADGKVRQDWNPSSACPDPLPQGYCKILMGTLMLAHDCLPRGGTVRVERGATNGQTRIIAEGQDAVTKPHAAEALARTLAPQDLDPRLVHPYVLSLLAGQYGMKVEIAEQAQGKVVLSLAA